ncbi:hypothetical protein NEAUS03_1675 [Nematocida ausubeli]|nr:hypothetical protein NEAUS03_1675 [Nematocida ausubeli]
MDSVSPTNEFFHQDPSAPHNARLAVKNNKSDIQQVVGRTMYMYDNSNGMIKTSKNKYHRMRNLYQSVFMVNVLKEANATAIDAISDRLIQEISERALVKTDMIMDAVYSVGSSSDFYTLVDNNYLSVMLMNESTFNFAMEDIRLALENYKQRVANFIPDNQDIVMYSYENDNGGSLEEIKYLLEKNSSGMPRILRVRDILKTNLGRISQHLVNGNLKKSGYFSDLKLTKEDFELLLYFYKAGEQGRRCLSLISSTDMIFNRGPTEHVCTFFERLYPFFKSNFDIEDQAWLQDVKYIIEKNWDIEDDFYREEEYFNTFLIGHYHRIQSKDILSIISEEREKAMASIYNLHGEKLSYIHRLKKAFTTHSIFNIRDRILTKWHVLRFKIWFYFMNNRIPMLAIVLCSTISLVAIVDLTIVAKDLISFVTN